MDTTSMVPTTTTTDECRRDTMAERRSSNASETSKQSCENNDSNPLMKLVDAALSPNSSLNSNASKAEEEEEEDQEKSPQEDRMDAAPAAAASTLPGAATETVLEEGLPKATPMEEEEKDPAAGSSGLLNAEGEKVIRGTVHDLVARQDKVTFAEYLMQCLADESNHDVLQWMPCGTQFTIVNHRKFTMERMPVLFKIRNMSSFVRKLTRWGFNRVHEKETGNSDIFKHDYFQRDKPELCKKIRCVNRSATAHDVAMTPKTTPMMMAMGGGGGGGMMMGRHSMGGGADSSMMPPHHHHAHPHHRPMMNHGGIDDEMHLVSPRRSIGHHPGAAPPFLPHRSPHGSSSQYATSPGRYHHHHHSPGSGNISTSSLMGSNNNSSPPVRRGGAPRVSPEYEREMLGAFPPPTTPGGSSMPQRPGPPQVYSPPTMGRSLSAAAEYELEQVLLDRQRARLYREQQHLQQQQQQLQQQEHQPSYNNGGNNNLRASGSSSSGQPSSSSSRMMGSGSERSSMGMGSLSERRYSVAPSESDFLSSASVTAALETLEREGEYDLDMSPREAMLRAVLHKRQQQRAAQQQQQKRASSTNTTGGGILKHSSAYYEASPSPSLPPATTRHPSYYR